VVNLATAAAVEEEGVDVTGTAAAAGAWAETLTAARPRAVGRALAAAVVTACAGGVPRRTGRCLAADRPRRRHHPRAGDAPDQHRSEAHTTHLPPTATSRFTGKIKKTEKRTASMFLVFFSLQCPVKRKTKLRITGFFSLSLIFCSSKRCKHTLFTDTVIRN